MRELDGAERRRRQRRDRSAGGSGETRVSSRNVRNVVRHSLVPDEADDISANGAAKTQNPRIPISRGNNEMGVRGGSRK